MSLEYEKFLRDPKIVSEEIMDELKKADFCKMSEIGVIESVADGIVTIRGLENAGLYEVINFDNNVRGIIYDLKEVVKVVVFDNHHTLLLGMRAYRTGSFLTVPVGNSIIGRIVTPFGEFLDQGPSAEIDEYTEIQPRAPAMMDRKTISEQLNTGVIATDSAIPIGLGQRQLIIGDSQSGKTAFAVGTIINQLYRYQSGDPMYCFYVAIGSQGDDIINIHSVLKKTGAIEYTTIIAAPASSSAHTQFIAPYAACSMAEYFMKKGKDCLIVYDDLTQHIVSYREMSRLLGKPAGRDAFPAESFFMHAKLLERAACLSDKYGGGSLTALPIIKTQDDDLGYIPTNVISITDGQIYMRKKYLDSRINVSLSVSRIGGAAQNDQMKAVSSNIKSSISRYNELLKTASFADPEDLEDATKKLLARGHDLSLLLNQNLYEFYTINEQIILLYAVRYNLFKSVEVDSAFERKHRFLEFVKHKNFNLQNTKNASIEDKVKTLVAEFLKENI